MKNIKPILYCVLALILGIFTFYMCFKTIDERLQSRAQERTISETVTETESETELEFEPIETVYEVAEVLTENVEQGYVLTESSNGQVNDFEQSSNGQVNDDDVMLLARVIQNEAGADIATDEHQRAVASVVVNRVADPRFPHDNIRDIVMCGWFDGHTIQYNFGSLEHFYSIVPTERAIANAQDVLTYGSTVGDAIYQDTTVQGEIVAVFSYPGTGFRTTYICR